MTGIQLNTQNDKYLISIDKSMFDKEWLVKLLENLRVEELARKFDFDESIETLGEEIKADWWEKNKKRLVNE